MDPRRASASQGRTQNDTADVVVAKKIPWMGISIALHVIALSVLIAFFAPREEDNQREFTKLDARVRAAPLELEPIPDLVQPRSAIPDLEVPVTPSEDQELDVLPLPDEEAGRPDLDNPTRDPNAIEAGDGFGFPGSTSIGVGGGGHIGERVSPHAGPKGPGGGLGHGDGKYKFRGDTSRKTPGTPIAGPALDWLARHQDDNGAWSPTGYVAHCEGVHCEGAGEDAHSVGVTGLALLAFLGAGNTLQHGDHHDVVQRGVTYLLDVQNKETGAFGEPGSSQAWIYDQAIATLAMCEAYGFSGNPTLKRAAQKAVYFCQSARNPYKAWRYAIPSNGDNDVSVTGWMVMVLRSAKDFDLLVDEQAFDGAKLFLDEMTDPNVGRTGYIQRGTGGAREPGTQDRWPAEKVEPMTAVAMMCRIFMGEDQATSPTLRQGADLLRKSLPSWDENAGTIDYYYWYAGSYAMFQMGGADWSAWEGKMIDAVATHQRKDGCERGSWDPRVDPWGHRGGRVYSTAMLALCSEVHTRYARMIIGKRDLKAPAPK